MQLEECPICYEELDKIVPECVNGHKACYECVRRLIQPNMHTCSQECSGYKWNCPQCRVPCCLNRVCVLALCTGTWKRGLESLNAGSRGCRQCARAWNRGESMCQDCKPPESEPQLISA